MVFGQAFDSLRISCERAWVGGAHGTPGCYLGLLSGGRCDPWFLRRFAGDTGGPTRESGGGASGVGVCRSRNPAVVSKRFRTANETRARLEFCSHLVVRARISRRSGGAAGAFGGAVRLQRMASLSVLCRQ